MNTENVIAKRKKIECERKDVEGKKRNTRGLGKFENSEFKVDETSSILSSRK